MTLSLPRPDDRGGARPMEKWLNSGWGNQHGILAPSMNPLLFSHQQQQQQQQSMFPQMMESAEQQGLLQAFMQQQARAELDSPPMHQLRVSGSLDTLLKSSNSSSMVDSVSDDECTAPENLQMNCISSLGGGGPMSPVLQSSLLDRTRSTGTSMMMNAKHFYHHHHRMESPVSPNSLPSRESDESLEAVATFKRHLEEDAEDEWLEQIHGVRAKLSKVGGHVGAAAAAFPQPVAFTNTTTVMPPSPPFLQEVNSSASLEMDKLASMREIVFRHASQPVPSLEEIASTRPKRRNVRISKDPQSVAARLRRERISDRIRVLQRLVPGGTKMDTASMLDEAIHYVKFLKLQLQTLEQIGNNSDPRGRPFDLNCTQGWSAPPAAVMTSLHHSQWRSDANSAFSDAVQEQFCH